MSELLAGINRFFAKNMFILVFSGLFAGFMVDISDRAFWQKTAMVLFAYMTLVTALNTSFRDFAATVKRPSLALWILFFVHIVSPLVALAVGAVFYPDEADTRLGYLIVASIPIGVSSLIWIGIVGGSLPTTILAVTLDTILTPFILPLMFHLAAAQSVEIDYLKMLRELLFMVTVPSLLGMLINDWSKKSVEKFAASFGGVTAKICVFIIIMINSAMVMPYIDWNAGIVKILLVTLFFVACGFMTGYLGSFAFKERSAETTLTMVYNVGIRNNACGLAIALAYFPPAVAVPITMSVLFQQPLATVVSKILKN